MGLGELTSMPLTHFTPDDPALPMSYPGFVFRILRDEGYSVSALLDETGLMADQIENPLFRTGFPPLQRFFLNAIKETQDPNLGVTLALRFEPGYVGLPAYAAMNASSFQDGIEVLVRFFSLNFPALELALITDQSNLQDDEAAIRVRSKFPFSGIEYFAISSALIAINGLLNAMLRQEHIMIRGETTLSRPEGWKVIVDKLHCPVSFEATENLLVFPKALLGQPLPGADPINHARFLMLCEQLATEAPYETTPVSQVVAFLETAPSLTVPLAAVAAELGYSERSLRRQLDRSGTSFRSLVGQIREQRARELLAKTVQPIKSIAGTLGFESSSNFARSFRRWTGKSPKEFRDAAQNGNFAGRK